MGKITACPHCGSVEGLFRRDYARGPICWRFGYHGEELDNGEMYDDLRIKCGKNLYCVDCEKKVCTEEEWEAQNGSNEE